MTAEFGLVQTMFGLIGLVWFGLVWLNCFLFGLVWLNCVILILFSLVKLCYFGLV